MSSSAACVAQRRTRARSPGVPFFVIDDRYGISGAQPTELFVEALATAWSDTHPIELVKSADDAELACTDDACAI